MRRTTTSRLLGCCWLLGLTLTSCSTPPSPLSEADYPGRLQPPTALPIEVVWQQHVTAQWQQGPDGEPQERGFDAAVQRQGDTLTVVGLSPMGSVGFSIVQSPDGVVVENNMPEMVPIPPRFILLDVQRTFFPVLGDAIPNGERVGRVAGEEVTETFAQGRLQQRTFTRLDGKPTGQIRISYQWGDPNRIGPTRAVLDNGWFGYQLTIDTHTETLLSPSTPPDER